MIEGEEQRAVNIVAPVSISDPAAAALLFGVPGTAVNVTQTSAMNLASVYRAVNVVAGTMATLPLKTYRLNSETGERTRVSSFLDKPAGPDSDMTAFDWVEQVMVHLLLWGNCYLLHLYNAANQIVGLEIISPQAVSIETVAGKKIFTILLEGGKQQKVTTQHLTHIHGISLDGTTGLSAIAAGRQNLSIALAGDIAAEKSFANGAMLSGLITPELADGDELSAEDTLAIKNSINTQLTGLANAGGFALINQPLKFNAWQLSPKDAQWLESRAFAINEVARWFGVSTNLLQHTEKDNSWGVSLQEQNRALARHCLYPWAARIEQKLSALLNPTAKFCEFEFAGLERPNPADEIALIISEVNGGLITLNEGRALRNMPPVEGGDAIRVPSGVQLLEQLEAAAEEEEVPATEEPTQPEEGGESDEPEISS